MCDTCNDLRFVKSKLYSMPIPCPDCGNWQPLISAYEIRLYNLFDYNNRIFYAPAMTQFLNLDKAHASGKERAIVLANTWIGAPTSGVLCLSGPSGVGKTTLARAALYAINRTDPVFEIDAEHMFRAIRQGYEDDTAEQKINALETAPALLIDDLGRVGHNIASDHVSRVLHAILSVRMHLASPTIITTNLSGEQFAVQFDETVRSRIDRWSKGLYAKAEIEFQSGFTPMGGYRW